MRLFNAPPLLIAAATATPSAAFSVPQCRTSSACPLLFAKRQRTLTARSAVKRGTEDDASRSALEDAFAQLDSLESLDDASVDTGSFDKDLTVDNLQALISDRAEDALPRDELQIYEELMSELDAGYEESDEPDLPPKGFGNTVSASAPAPATTPVSVEAPIEKSEAIDFDLPDMDGLMERALSEAIQEANNVTDASIDKNDILRDESLKKEIDEIFAKANADLAASLEEIREEQKMLAKQSAEASLQQTDAVATDYDQRLADAETNMRQILDKVNRESEAVRKAAEDLERAKEESQNGSQQAMLNLRKAGIVKQSALVGTFLFAIRSLIDTVAYVATADESHLLPAIVQSALTVVCFIILKFL